MFGVLPKEFTDFAEERTKKIKVIDVGCAPAGGADNPDPYAPLGEQAEVVGFDAQHGQVIGDGSYQRLRITAHPMQSSLFEPNFQVLDRFADLSPMFQVVETRTVKTERLDDIVECGGADYLKMDVQGAECLVLAGAAQTLKSVLVVHAEITYIPFYKGQAMIGDLDTALRAAGFMFHMLLGVGQRTMTGIEYAGNRRQFLYSDAIYIRPFEAWPALSEEQRRKTSVILRECYDSHEMADAVLHGQEVAHV